LEDKNEVRRVYRILKDKQIAEEKRKFYEAKKAREAAETKSTAK
jgi:hypothetical protein